MKRIRIIILACVVMLFTACDGSHLSSSSENVSTLTEPASDGNAEQGATDIVDGSSSSSNDEVNSADDTVESNTNFLPIPPMPPSLTEPASDGNAEQGATDIADGSSSSSNDEVNSADDAVESNTNFLPIPPMPPSL